MSKLERTVKSLYRVIKPVNNVTSAVGMVCLAAMMFLTAADVFLRYSFDKPIMGSYELIQFMMVITISVGLAYTALEKGHVTLDVVASRFPKRLRALFDSLVGLLGLVVASIMTWQACAYILTLAKSQLLSTVLLIPVYPFVAIVAVGLAFFSLVLVVHILEFVMAGGQK